MTDKFIPFIIANTLEKSNIKLIDLGTGDGTFLFDLIDDGRLTFIKIQGVDNGTYEEQLETNFEEDFDEMLESYAYGKVIPEYIKTDEFNYMKSVTDKYDIITAQNFLHFFDWQTICNNIEMLMTKLEKNGSVFIVVANTEHTKHHIKFKFSYENILELKTKFNVIWKKENKHYHICLKKG